MRKKRKDYFRYLIYAMTLFSVILFIFTIIASKTARAAIFVALFIILNMIIASYKRFIRLPIEFEVLTLGIVICTVQFGLKTGLVLAILGGILSFVVGYNINPFSFPMLLGYILIAFVSFLFKGLDITLVGILATLANNLFVFTAYYYAFRYDFFKNLSFSLSNIVLNVIFFLNLAPFLMKLIF